MPDIDELRDDANMDAEDQGKDGFDWLQEENEKRDKKLREELRNTWKKPLIIGFCLGIVASIIGSMIFGFITTQSS